MTLLQRLSGALAAIISPLTTRSCTARPNVTPQDGFDIIDSPLDTVQRRKKRKQTQQRSSPSSTYKRRKTTPSHVEKTNRSGDEAIKRETPSSIRNLRFTLTDGSVDGSQVQGQDESERTSDSRAESAPQCELNEESFLTSDEEDYDDDADMTIDASDSISMNSSPSGDSNQKTRPLYRRIPAIPPNGAITGLSAAGLQDAGWDEAHIELVGHIANRGYEAVIPLSWQQGMPFIPETLFTNQPGAVLQPYQSGVGKGEIMFEKLLKIGGHIRIQLPKHEGRTPQEIAGRCLKDYMKWALLDSGLHMKRALPIVKLVIAARDTDDKALVARTTRVLQRLSDKYKHAFQAYQSTEITASSPRRTSPATFHAIPTLYALIASDAIIALAALKPGDPRLQSVAFFDFTTCDLDFWSVLALAMIIAHGRDMQVQIAEETGLGCKLPTDLPEPDPDA